MFYCIKSPCWIKWHICYKLWKDNYLISKRFAFSYFNEQDGRAELLHTSHPVKCDSVTGSCLYNCPAGRTGEKCDQGTWNIFLIVHFVYKE